MTTPTSFFEPELTQRLGIFDTPCAGLVRLQYHPTIDPNGDPGRWTPVQAKIHVDFQSVPLRSTGIRIEVQGRGLAVNGYYDSTLKAGALTVYGMLTNKPSPIWLMLEPDPEFWPEGVPSQETPINFRVYLADELLLSIPLRLPMEDSEHVLSLRSIP